MEMQTKSMPPSYDEPGHSVQFAGSPASGVQFAGPPPSGAQFAEPPPSGAQFAGPPPSGWSPPQAQPGVVLSPVTIIPGQTIAVAAGPLLGPQPQPLQCRSCHKNVVSHIQYKSSTKTHLFALCLCCIGFVFCAWIPYCINSCKNIDHYCPHCQAYIGSYKS